MKKFLCFFLLLFCSLSAGTVVPVDSTTAFPAVTVGTNPTAVAVGNTHAFVVNTASNSVTAIDLTTFATTNIPVNPNPIAVVVGATNVFVLHGGSPSEVTAFSQTAPFPFVAGTPTTIGNDATALGAGINYIFAVNTGDGSVSVFDDPSGSLAVPVPIAVGPSPRDVAVGTSHAYVVNGDNTITPIDLGTFTALTAIASTGLDAFKVTVPINFPGHDDDAFVLNRGDNTVTVIMGLVAQIPMSVGTTTFKKVADIKPFQGGDPFIIVTNAEGEFTAFDLIIPFPYPASSIITGGAPTNIASGTNFFFITDPLNNLVIPVDTNLTPQTALGVTNPGAIAVLGTSDAYVINSDIKVTKVSPDIGPTAGGISVVITGNGFLGASAVDFGPNPVVTYTVDSATQITATLPAGAAGMVDVVVTNSSGTSKSPVNALDEFTYITTPGVTSVSPDQGSGSGGTIVTIGGFGFTGATAVDFDGFAAASFTVDSDIQITATSPAGTGIVDVTVTGPSGTSPLNPLDQFKYLLPTITNVSPNQGPGAGGTPVTITGSIFTGATDVSFGGTPATSFTVDSDTQITATSPAGSGAVDITVTSPAGTSDITPLDVFTYNLPDITNVSPNEGPLVGGIPVNITGVNFTGTSDVSFGGTPVGFVFNSDSSISVTSPAGVAGTVDITVTTASGTSAITPLDQFTFTAAPGVTSVTPNEGPLAGGIPVTIGGFNFTGATAVDFGGTPAIGFTVDDDFTITATPPAGAAGTVDVVVTGPTGSSQINPLDEFTYTTAPGVTSVSPNQGPGGGGTIVTIGGFNFTPATGVTFGGTPAASFTVDSDIQITATSPAGSGIVDIRVTSPSGTSSITPLDQFTYLLPDITNVAPNQGPGAGGTSVTITGTSFTGATDVSFGGTPATSFTVDLDTQITATSPAGAGAVDITVTTPAGTSNITPLDVFTYFPPDITNVSPNQGPDFGGTSVNITGVNFTGAFDVSFGGTPATFVFNSDSSITATSPAGAPGTVDITVSTDSGISAITPLDQFTYIVFPGVTSVTPNQGPLAGGTAVTIAGFNFTGATAVDFGATPAAGFIVVNDNTITATSPASAAGTVDVRVTTPSGTSAITPLDQFTYLSSFVLSVFGSQKTAKSLFEKDIVNEISWNSIPTAAYYRVFDGNNNLLFQGTALSFFDHDRKGGIFYTYSVTWVDSLGNESSPVTIVIP